MGGQNFIINNRKRCMGPLHDGDYVPLDHFYKYMSGPRLGRPFARCKSCQSVRKRADAKNPMIVYDKVKFVFDELQNRLGKMEACRRLGVSHSFFSRRKSEGLKKIQRKTVIRAMHLLRECRENEEARHRSSIRRGATLRGEKERKPVRARDYYNTTQDNETEDRRSRRLTSLEA